MKVSGTLARLEQFSKSVVTFGAWESCFKGSDALVAIMNQRSTL